VQMMCQNSTFKVAAVAAEKVKILELPFASGELSMLVLLPDDVSGLEQVRPRQGNQRDLAAVRPFAVPSQPAAHTIKNGRDKEIIPRAD